MISESRLPMRDGTQIFIRDWLLDEHHSNHNPQPCIVMLHGLAEHCGRYEHIATFLNSLGFAVRTYDHRGHGLSSGARGDCPDLISIVNDAEVIIRDFSQRCQTVPILFGHSMGGLYAARIAAGASEVNLPLRGLILSSPALKLPLSWLDTFFLKLLAHILPHTAFSFSVKPDDLSHELSTYVAYISDPLVHRKITPSLLNSMLSAIAFVKKHAEKLTIPTLLLVAEEDHLVDPKGSHDFFAAVPKQICTAHFYAGYYHEIFNESGADKVFGDLQNWLANQNFG